MPKKVTCPDCGEEAYYAVVSRYVWQREGQVDVIIEEAQIVRCGDCGEIPADGDEEQRWQRIAWRDQIDYLDTDEDQCDTCGRPETETGQFFRFGPLWEEDIETLCYDCKVSKYGE